MSVSQEQIVLLRQFVDLCKTNISVLHIPQLKFYKEWIESLGGNIPAAEPSSKHSSASHESGDGNATGTTTEKEDAPMDETPSQKEDDGAESESPTESDLELDMESDGVIEGDSDPPLEMGDSSLEVTEEMNDQSSAKRQEAMDATNENRLADAITLYTEAIKLNPLSAVLFAKRANVLIRLEKPNAAIADCDRAIALNPDSAQAYKWRGKARRLIGDWLGAYNDLNTSNRMDYDESIVELLHEVEGNAKKIMEHRRRYEREHEEKDIQIRKKKVKEAREKYEHAKRESESKDDGMPGGFPGGFPGGMSGGFPGGMPTGPRGAAGGMPGGMPDISALFSDPELMAAFQDPEVLTAFQDVSKNPENISKYDSNPKIKKLIEKMSSKFGDKSGPSGGASTP